MTPEETRKAAEVMLAHANGQEIQVRLRVVDDRWTPVTEPKWSWASREYRVNPEPAEFWVNCYPDDQVVHMTPEQAAEGLLARRGCGVTIHVREVMDHTDEA